MSIAERASLRCGNSFYVLTAAKYPKRIAMPTMPRALLIGLAIRVARDTNPPS
jgi:hypothetical protein